MCIRRDHRKLHFCIYATAFFSQYCAMDEHMQNTPREDDKSNSWRTAFIVLIAILVTAALTFWIVKTFIFPSEFKPVELSAREEQVLEQKLDRLEGLQPGSLSAKQQQYRDEMPADGESLSPEAYSEEGAERSITFTERELNSLVAKNTDMARKVAIDLSDSLMSAKLLIPVDEDFPVMGGQILKVRAGVEMAYREGRPIVKLRGVSVMGVPVPNAWLGGLKNIDLVENYGTDEGFWKAFAAGVNNIEVRDGNILLELKE